MAVYACRRCGYEQKEEWLERCPGCDGFYCGKAVTGSASEEGGGLMTLGGKGARSSQRYISTGSPGFDRVMGGGLLAGRVVLLGGFAGAGKTRLLLAISDHIAKTQGIVIYASGEESAGDINSIAGSLGLVNDRVKVLGNQSCVEEVQEVAKKLRAFLVVYDSAQEFVSTTANGMPGSTPQCKAVGKVIKKYCGDTKTCAIIVNQMTGEGGLKGGTELEHACDTINLLAFPKEDDEDAPGFEDEGYRVLLNANKNRGGVANLKSYFRMTDAGVLEHVQAKTRIIDLAGARGKYRRN